jgi:hypothetical protein
MARPMSSIIPGRRDRTSATAPVRKGQPPHQNTIEPSTGAMTSRPGTVSE